MTHRMKALESFRLRGNRVNPGDVFRSSDRDVAMLKLATLAEVTDETAKRKAGRRSPHSAQGQPRRVRVCRAIKQSQVRDAS